MRDLVIIIVAALPVISYPQHNKSVILSDFTREIIEYYIDEGFSSEDEFVEVFYGFMGYNTFLDGKWSRESKGLLEIRSSDYCPDTVPTMTINGVKVGFHESCSSNPFFSLNTRKLKTNEKKSGKTEDAQPEYEIVDTELLSEMWRFCFNEDGTFNPLLSNTYFNHSNTPTCFAPILEIVSKYFPISKPTETDMKLYYPYPDIKARPVIGDEALFKIIHDNFPFNPQNEKISITLLVDENGNSSFLNSSVQPYELTRYQTLKSLGDKLSGLKFYPASFRGYNVRSLYYIDIPAVQDELERVPVLFYLNRGLEF